MAGTDRSDTSKCLSQASQGDARASDKLVQLVYDQLRDLASGYLRRERPGHTLQPRALVHEAYMNLVVRDQASWKVKTHILAVAAGEMKRVWKARGS